MRLVGLGVIVLLAAVGCQRGSMGQAGAGPTSGADASAPGGVPSAETREADREAERLIAGNSEDGDKAMEAREYLKPDQEKNGLWKTSREQTSKWVEDLYDGGAAKVYAVYSPADESIPVNMCASLLIELPAAKDTRAKTLAAFNAIDADLWGEDHDEAKDEGQKFAYLSMDP